MSFDSLLINKAKVVQIAVGDWLEPSPEVKPELPCRIMYENKLVRDYKGEEVISTAKVFFKPKHLTFGHEDKLQFDIESYKIDHPIVIIKRPQDSTKIHHGEVRVS